MLHNIYFMGAIVPCVMFFCGCMMYRMRLKPNNFAGYRTGMSMRNEAIQSDMQTSHCSNNTRKRKKSKSGNHII